MEIYVLIEENVDDFENYKKVRVFTNLNKANEEVLKLRNEFIENNFIEDFEVEDDTNNDQPLKSFKAWEDGNYNNNHYLVTLWQREIEED